MATRAPPRFVPTLTEVVPQSAPAPTSVPLPLLTDRVHAAGPAAAPAGTSAPPPTAAPLSADQLAQRVLQRLDLTLERRVREAIASVVLEQTSSLAPVLRERLDTVVRQAVAQAVHEELQSRQRAGGPSV